MANDIIDIVVTDNSDNVQLNVTPNLVSINVSQTSGNIIGSNYFLSSSFAALPVVGDLTTLYITNDTSLLYRWNGSSYTQVNSVTSWGTITGTLSAQTDLQNALNLKAPLASPTFTGTVSGITKSMVGLSNVDNTSDANKPVSTATQTALDGKEPNITAGTISQYYRGDKTFQSLDTTAVVEGSNLYFTNARSRSSISLTTTGTSGAATYDSATGVLNVPAYQGGVTSFNTRTGAITLTSGDVTTALGYIPVTEARTLTINGTTYDLSANRSWTIASGVTSFNTRTGAIIPAAGDYTTALVTEDTNLYYTNNRSRNAISLTTTGTSGNATYDNTTGILNIPAYQGGVTSFNTRTGAITLSSTDITTALGYTPYNATNPNGYTTNVGTVTSVGGTGTVSGLSLSGSVTTSGDLTLGGSLSLTSGNVTSGLGFTPENAANKGVANGYASLDGGGLIPSTQLPSYVDDVLEFSDLASFPASGVTGKIYVALDTNKIYRWSGATYIEVSPTVGTIWGGITGTLSNQTDLQSILDGKQDDLNGTGFVKASGTTISYDNSTYYPFPTGTTSQYVRGDGTLETFPSLTGYVPYTGATTNVNLGTHSLTAADLVINHTSGSGVAASITKGGNGEALTVVKSSGSGNAASITGGITLLDELHLNTDLDDAYIASAATWNAKQNALSGTGFVKISGTTISYDNSTYYLASNPSAYIALTALSSSATGLTYTNTTGVFSLTSGYVIPTTSSATNWDTAYTNRITSLTTTGSSGAATLTSNTLNIPTYTLAGLDGVPTSRTITINGTALDLSADRSFTVVTDPNSRNVQDYTATSGQTTFTVTNGYVVGLLDVYVNGSKLTSSEFTATNGTTFVLTIASVAGDQVQSINYTASVNGVSGSGTANYVPKFTASGTIGNSSIQDSGSALTFGLASTFSSSVTANGNGTTSSFYSNNNGSGAQYYQDFGNGAGFVSGRILRGNGASGFAANGLNILSYDSLQLSANATGGSGGSINLLGGNVGIGTSSPSTTLDVRATPSSDWGNLTLFDTRTAATGQGGVITFSGYKTSTTAANIFAKIAGGNENGNGTENGYLSFITNTGTTYAERMRITSGGNVGIGTTNPSGWALSLGAIATDGGLNITVGVPTLVANFNNSSNNPTNVRWNNFNGNFYDIANNPSNNSYTIDYNDTIRFTISSNGSIGAPSGTNIYNASDARLKKNISTTTYGLNAISALNPVMFNWVDGFEPSEDGKDMLGFVAQEVQEVLPEAIESFGGNSITFGDTIIDNPLRVNEKFIIPVLVKAIQELSAQASEQQTQINELKAEIDILKNK